MVIFDNNFRKNYPEAVYKARTEKIRVVKLEDNLYYVARRAAGHGRYLVYLDVASTGTVTATCKTLRGVACPSYGCCAHLAKVFLRLEAEVKKIQRKDAA